LTKPSIGSAKPKPFDIKPKPVEDQKNEIQEEIPPTKPLKVEDPEPVNKYPKPFVNPASKSKPTFGKFSKPFANNTSANDSKISDQEEPKDPPKQEPISFTEKYGLAKKEDPAPLPQNNVSAGAADNQPWMRGNQEEGYIPTVGGTNLPRRIVRQQQSEVPTIGRFR
jgi:hypothetical protein